MSKYVHPQQGYTDLWILDIDSGGMAVIFVKKQEKIIFKEIILKNGKNLGVGQKYDNRKTKRKRF